MKYQFTDVTYEHADIYAAMVWLTENVRARDVRLKRWHHHYSNGDNRSHWDMILIDGCGSQDKVIFRFTHKDTAMLFKLTFGGK